MVTKFLGRICLGFLDRERGVVLKSCGGRFSEDINISSPTIDYVSLARCEDSGHVKIECMGVGYAKTAVVF